jgi:phage tail sheath gpL-like
MATIYDMVIVAHDETSANAQVDLQAESGLVELAGLKLKDYFRRIVSGMRPATVQTKVNAVKATGTITLSSHVATNTVTINGVTLTADTDYAVGGDDSETATALAAAINADSDLDGLVSAAADAAVVTLTALIPGELGNAVTLAISANGSVSAARMSGGTNGDAEKSHTYGSLT